jgi:hypothetical protein
MDELMAIKGNILAQVVVLANYICPCSCRHPSLLEFRFVEASKKASVTNLLSIVVLIRLTARFRSDQLYNADPREATGHLGGAKMSFTLGRMLIRFISSQKRMFSDWW